MKSLEKNKTWVLVPKPKGVKNLACKWLNKKKDGISRVKKPRFKSRLVSKGFAPRSLIDFTEILSPMVTLQLS